MRGPDTVSPEASATGPRERSRRPALAAVTLGTVLVAGSLWNLARRPAGVSQAGASRAGNLLVNGSFEQPVGNLLTVGVPLSRWQRFRTWWSMNSAVNRARISRRQAPVLMPSLPTQPELTGWQVLKGSVDIVGSSYWQQPAGGGRQSLDLIGTPGAATIEQTFPTEPGREYILSGWLSHNPVIAPRLTRRVDVSLNGSLAVQLAHGDPNTTRKNMRWKRFSHRFRATSSRTTLRLADVTATSSPSRVADMATYLCGAVLDDLSVTPASTAHPAP